MPQKRMRGNAARRDQARTMGSSMQSEDEPPMRAARGMFATAEAPKRGTRKLASGRGRSLQGRAVAARMSSARRGTSASKAAAAKPKKASGRKAAPRRSGTARKRARSR